jgi:hypothetical protein
MPHRLAPLLLREAAQMGASNAAGPCCAAGNLNTNGQELLVYGRHFGNVFIGVQVCAHRWPPDALPALRLLVAAASAEICPLPDA